MLTLAPAGLPAAACPSTLDVLEDAHARAVRRRKRLLSLHSLTGDPADWDRKHPLNASHAWMAYTVWDVFAPTYGCQHPSTVGGLPGRRPPSRGRWDVTKLPLESKSMCRPAWLRRQTPCVVYSFGTGFDTSFELAILRLAPRCTVRTFDPTVPPERYWDLVRRQMALGVDESEHAKLASIRKRLTFSGIGLGNATEGVWSGSKGLLWDGSTAVRVASLASLMSWYGDQHIDVLKIDVRHALQQTVPLTVILHSLLISSHSARHSLALPKVESNNARPHTGLRRRGGPNCVHRVCTGRGRGARRTAADERDPARGRTAPSRDPSTRLP